MKYNKQNRSVCFLQQEAQTLFVFDELVSLEIVSKTIHEEVIFFFMWLCWQWLEISGNSHLENQIGIVSIVGYGLIG